MQYGVPFAPHHAALGTRFSAHRARPRGPRRWPLVALVAAVPATGGCATIYHLFVSSRPTIEVDSEPPGAEVFLDDRPVGLTPATVPVEHRWDQRLRVEYRGYRAESQPVAMDVSLWWVLGDVLALFPSFYTSILIDAVTESWLVPARDAYFVELEPEAESAPDRTDYVPWWPPEWDADPAPAAPTVRAAAEPAFPLFTMPFTFTWGAAAIARHAVPGGTGGFSGTGTARGFRTALMARETLFGAFDVEYETQDFGHHSVGTAAGQSARLGVSAEVFRVGLRLGPMFGDPAAGWSLAPYGGFVIDGYDLHYRPLGPVAERDVFVVDRGADITRAYGSRWGAIGAWTGEDWRLEGEVEAAHLLAHVTSNARTPAAGLSGDPYFLSWKGRGSMSREAQVLFGGVGRNGRGRALRARLTLERRLGPVVLALSAGYEHRQFQTAHRARTKRYSVWTPGLDRPISEITDADIAGVTLADRVTIPRWRAQTLFVAVSVALAF